MENRVKAILKKHGCEFIQMTSEVRVLWKNCNNIIREDDVAVLSNMSESDSFLRSLLNSTVNDSFSVCWIHRIVIILLLGDYNECYSSVSILFSSRCLADSNDF